MFLWKIMQFLLLWSVFISSGIKADAQGIDASVEHIKRFVSEYPREKVYLHFDNTCYFVGDTIWFKANLVNSLSHTGSGWSRTLYVEFLSPEGVVITTKRYKTTDTGECHGHLVLQDSLRAGFYEVRAFTRWMMNFGDADVFSRVFTVFRKPLPEGNYEMEIERRYRHVPDYRKKNFWRQSNGRPRLSVTFYPEGGNLVKGLRSLVAFKATGPDGENVEVTGIVRDQSGRDMAFFLLSMTEWGCLN